VNAAKRALISLPQHRRAEGSEGDAYESGGKNVFVTSFHNRKWLAQGTPMTDKSDAEDDDLAAIRRGRDRLIEQIRISQGTIDRSKELIRQMDELLGRRGVKP
jgi:hypothetical protein